MIDKTNLESELRKAQAGIEDLQNELLLANALNNELKAQIQHPVTEYLRLEHKPPIEYSVLLKTSDKKIAEFLLFEDGVWYCLMENNGLHPDYILIELGTKLKQLNN